MIGRVLSDEFFENRDWPLASAVAILMLLLLVVPIMLFQRSGGRQIESHRMKTSGWFPRTMLGVGLTFLYAPILSMMVFSLNNSRLVTVWDAAHSPTLKWYAELLGNDEILDAAWLSIRIALIAASGAVVLGTLTGVALARFGPFRGRTLLVGMTTAPLVMPEVITGLALLLLFITLQQAIGWPRGTGMVTIILAHITFCTAYVAVVVQSRLVGFDESLEEAALDLGRAARDGVPPHHPAAGGAGAGLRMAAVLHPVVG